MSFWSDVKNEWCKPFKGTKKEKTDFWLNMLGTIGGIALWNLYLKTDGMPFYKELFGLAFTIFVCDIAVALFFTIIIRIKK